MCRGKIAQVLDNVCKKLDANNLNMAVYILFNYSHVGITNVESTLQKGKIYNIFFYHITCKIAGELEMVCI